MLQTAEIENTTGLYRLWKIEKQIWLNGLTAMNEHVLPSAIIISPPPLSPMKFQDLSKLIGRAEPFQNIEFSDQTFSNFEHTILLYYRASAKHKRYRRRYSAQCMTTYIRQKTIYKIAGHSHYRLPK